jgi:hypothetical protein
MFAVNCAAASLLSRPALPPPLPPLPPLGDVAGAVLQTYIALVCLFWLTQVFSPARTAGVLAAAAPASLAWLFSTGPAAAVATLRSFNAGFAALSGLLALVALPAVLPGFLAAIRAVR